tara:strand:- start:159 stop:518 length:360 start_codon:yes stop_codon:yes gene_type:complete
MNQRNIIKIKIQEFVEVKKQYDSALKELDELRKYKNDIENNLIEVLRRENLENRILLVDNNKIQQRQITSSSAITLKCIKEILKKYNNEINQELDAENLLEYIKRNRPKVSKTELKLYK